MVDFIGNPYLNDPSLQLSPEQMHQYRLSSLGSALTNFGAGIAGAGAAGQPWFAGIAPGAAMASRSMSENEGQISKMQMAALQYQLQNDYKKAQEKELGLRSTQLEMDQKLQNEFLKMVPGLTGYQPPQGPLMTVPGATGPQGNAIGKIEGDYNSVGPPADNKGSRGLGKYQVMDYNVGPWTKEALGQELTPQQYLASPQAQDAVFNHKFGQYRQKYGDVGAAKAWFAGEGGMNNPNAKDVNGMTVANYGNQFVANGGAAAAPGGAGPTMASLPPFQGPGMGPLAMQPDALPPGASPQVNLPPQFAQAGGPPVIPQGGDNGMVAPGQPQQPPQMAPQMPPGMPGPPPNNAGLMPFMMNPRLAPAANFMTGQQKQQYEYQWKAYQAAQEAEKNKLAAANQPIQLGPDGQPVISAMVPQAEATKAAAIEAAKNDPAISAGAARAAGEKAAAEETAKANARLDQLFPKGYQAMKPDQIRAEMAKSNPLMLGTIDSMGKYDMAPSELSNRPAGAMGLTKAETIAATKVLYPDYSVRLAEQHKDFVDDYMKPNGAGGKVAASLSNGAQHVADLADAYNQLKNGQFPQGNKWFNETATKLGWDKLTPFETIQRAIGPEIAKVISSGSDTAVGEREEATALLSAWNNPKTQAGVFERVAGLMEKRRNTLYAQADKAAVPREFIDQSIGDYGTNALASLRSAIKVPEDKSQSMQPKSGDPMEGRTATGPNGAKVIRRNGAWVSQ